MDRRPTRARRLAALSLLLASTAISPVLAASFTVNAGSDTIAKSVTGTDRGTVAARAALSTSGTAITWTGPSNPPGVVIDNSGTISSSTSRGIDTSGSNAVRNFTLNNNASAVLSGFNDAFRIKRSPTSSATASTSITTSSMRRKPICQGATIFWKTVAG